MFSTAGAVWWLARLHKRIGMLISVKEGHKSEACISQLAEPSLKSQQYMCHIKPDSKSGRWPSAAISFIRLVWLTSRELENVLVKEDAYGSLFQAPNSMLGSSSLDNSAISSESSHVQFLRDIRHKNGPKRVILANPTGVSWFGLTLKDLAVATRMTAEAKS